ncbi:arsenical pump-driving ATPase [Paenibacillus sabinae]|uniref:Arsenite-translocating ATPase ArsA n=1 Tax=Paenibacillus sabinae T27 TaxID=1268072 RepID=X4ZL47_9BACL|nr:arsenical pump-driving ATPase [Paenibacillus sabinae]AHV97400.1 arsenite-translocating ATPase ArsA [Paenibacillus sabinae T27]
MSTRFDPLAILRTPYLFFTGKGGVGKTSTACAAAVALADSGKKVLLVSTDPASNLQDAFGLELSNLPIAIEGVPNLFVANLDPETAVEQYKAKVVGPYRGVLPDSVISTMEEQLSGACTVEIAAFDEFTTLLTDEQLRSQFDHILFDTAPTGHTLRLLQLPAAWNGFLEESTHGASCLGPLAGLERKKEVYEQAVRTLSDQLETTLVLVTRPDRTPLLESARAAEELREIGVTHQILIVNGLLLKPESEDSISFGLYERQQTALRAMPHPLTNLSVFHIPLVAYNILGVDRMRQLFKPAEPVSLEAAPEEAPPQLPSLSALIDDVEQAGIRILFTMGKGGVGKTTVASALAVGLAERGHNVHLSTTDPAAHIESLLGTDTGLISLSKIDPKAEVDLYRQEVISQNAELLDEEGLAVLEEDLRSPCTEEIAVFRAFAELVERSKDQIVVIDTAPTGHTLLLLDASEEYHKEVARSAGEVPDSVRKLLPRLRNAKETAVIIVTLAEATPFYEASRLEEDLKRAEISVRWWTINQSLAASGTEDPILKGRAMAEVPWIREINNRSDGQAVIIPWRPKEIRGVEQLTELVHLQ